MFRGGLRVAAGEAGSLATEELLVKLWLCTLLWPELLVVIRQWLRRQTAMYLQALCLFASMRMTFCQFQLR